MELMNLLLYRSLKAQFKDVPMDTIHKIKDNFALLIQEREEEIKQQEELALAQQRKFDEGIQALKDLGIDINEFTEKLTGKEKKPSKRKGIKMEPKYKYYDLDTKAELYWSGQGKLPNKLKELMDAMGTDLEDYLL